MSELKVVFDVEKMRPACALIQTAAGATPGVANLWPSDLWLIPPTDGMRTLKGSREQLEALLEETTPDPDTPTDEGGQT